VLVETFIAELPLAEPFIKVRAKNKPFSLNLNYIFGNYFVGRYDIIKRNPKTIFVVDVDTGTVLAERYGVFRIVIQNRRALKKVLGSTARDAKSNFMMCYSLLMHVPSSSKDGPQRAPEPVEGRTRRRREVSAMLAGHSTALESAD
jgi:hypothetical protein